MPDPAQERPYAPIFYSELMRVVQNLDLEKASGDQWLGTLNNLRGVKKEEIRWVGLPEWLAGQQGPVTKSEVLDYLSAMEVRVEEVVKGGRSFAEIIQAVAFEQGFWEQIEKADNPDVGKWEINFRDTPCGVFTTEQEAKEALIQEARDFLESYPERRSEFTNADTEFPDYQLPGGENYRELLLILPMPGEDEVRDRNYYSPHFDEENVLVHVRFNERTDIDGKRLLFIEEIQSDWTRKAGSGDIGKERPRTPRCTIMRRTKVFRTKRRGRLRKETIRAIRHGKRWRNGWRRKKGKSSWHGTTRCPMPPSKPPGPSWP